MLNRNRNINLKSSVKKPFCKVCQDAGKSESVYTSHYVRSQPDHNGNTKVTCPLLAVTECRYCYQPGHTTKFCPVLEENNKRFKHDTATIRYQKAEQRNDYRRAPAVEKKNIGAFAALADDSDDESPAKRVIVMEKEEFPLLTASSAVAQVTTRDAVNSISYAAVAEKPAEVVYKRDPPKVTQTMVPKITKTWADLSDSDTEYEWELPEVITRNTCVYKSTSCYTKIEDILIDDCCSNTSTIDDWEW